MADSRMSSGAACSEEASQSAAQGLIEEAGIASGEAKQFFGCRVAGSKEEVERKLKEALDAHGFKAVIMQEEEKPNHHHCYCQSWNGSEDQDASGLCVCKVLSKQGDEESKHFEVQCNPHDCLPCRVEAAIVEGDSASGGFEQSFAASVIDAAEKLEEVLELDGMKVVDTQKYEKSNYKGRSN